MQSTTSNKSHHHARKMQKKWGTKLSRAIALPALIGLVVLICYYVVPVGLASAWYFKANYYLDLWVKNEKLFKEDSWHQAIEAIDTAVKLHPNHPHYLLTKAKLNEWGWYNGLMTTEQLEASESLYTKAIELRPTWPNAHADYAYFLGVTQFRITEAYQQLALAKKYGPYLPQTILRQLAVGYAQWQHLNGEQKVQTFAALKNALVSDYSTYQQALALTRSAQKAKMACTYLRASRASFDEKTQKRILNSYCKK